MLGLVIKIDIVFCGFPAAKCILCSVTFTCVQGSASQAQADVRFLLTEDDFQQQLQQMVPWKVLLLCSPVTASCCFWSLLQIVSRRCISCLEHLQWLFLQKEKLAACAGFTNCLLWNGTGVSDSLSTVVIFFHLYISDKIMIAESINSRQTLPVCLVHYS